MKSRARVAFVAALIPLLALACDTHNSQKEEAGRLLERISAVDLRAPFDVREHQIEALRELPLKQPAVREARARCVDAHAGLLAAERAQSRARTLLDQTEDGGTRDRAALENIAQTLSLAARTLRASQKAMPACEQRAKELALER